VFDLRHLHHAVALAEHRNFGLASEAIHLSQSALSRSIQSLEDSLGLQIFERRRKGVEPTDMGALFLRRARVLLAQAEDLKRESQIMNTGRLGELRIAAGPYPARMVVAPAIGDLIRRHAGLRFQLRVDDWVTTARLVRERHVDLAICEQSEIEDAELELVPMLRHQAYPVVASGHPLAGRGKTSMREIMRWPLAISARLPTRVLERFLPATDGKGFKPTVQCDELGTVINIVQNSEAVCLTPLSVVERELSQDSLAVLPCEESWLHTSYAILRIRDRLLSPSARMFIETAQEIDRECLRREQKLKAVYLPGEEESKV